MMWRQLWHAARRRWKRNRRIFVYEHVTAGGFGDDVYPATDPLFPEGAAMLSAVLRDFFALDDVGVTALVDSRAALECPRFYRSCLVPVASAAERERRFDELSRQSDGVLLIAPETDGVLVGLAERVERLGGRLLSPGSEFVRWATDKTAVYETMTAENVPMPRGVRLTGGDPWPADFAGPAVLKPNDGCGSQDIRVLTPADGDARTNEHAEWRLEQLVQGRPASLLVLLGSNVRTALVPCEQRLSDDGRLQYLGGRGPLTGDLAVRVTNLFERVFPPLPDWRGFIGLDLVLGDAPDGSADYLIEVNPRLTTSYVGVKNVYKTNLMRLMLDMLDDRPASLVYRPGAFAFDKQGQVDAVCIEES